MGKSIEIERQIVGRIHRLEGQVRSLERILGRDDPEQAVIQMEAIIAAARGCLALYLESLIEAPIDPAIRQKLITRVIKKIN